jgi:uncharacterized membrane protein YdfJ with MMPL/SSD domain
MVTDSPFFKLSAGLTINLGVVLAPALVSPKRPPAIMLLAMTTTPTAIRNL